MGWYGRERKTHMTHDYEYVSRKEFMPVKKELIHLIHDVQNELRDEFTFQYYFIGSTSRGMITRDKKSNTGYDFDLDFYPNIYFDDYSPKELRNIFIAALNICCKKYGYATCENSTRVITIKVKDQKNSRIKYSCDIAIVFDFDDDTSWYIHFNKKQNSFEWQQRPNPYYVEEKADSIKEAGYWNKVKDLYIYLKNIIEKKSRLLYAEAVSAIYNQYFNI